MPQGLMLAERHPLDAFFSPRRIVAIGAREKPGSIGRTTFHNLLARFPGEVLAVNPEHTTVLGAACWPTVGEVPGPIDLAVIMTPGEAVPALIRACGAKGIPAAIVISAGFREQGPAGRVREQELQKAAREARVRILGPSSWGLVVPSAGLNASFAHAMAEPGHIAFLSQSGAMCTAVLDWSLTEHVGFSAFASVGGMTDVSWGDLIDYFGQEFHTRAILLYMETIGDARRFLSAAREVALSKPIIVIKGGRTAAGQAAARAHTGADTASDAVIDAAFARCGVLRVHSIADLFQMSHVLDKQPRPKGGRLLILTNGGGPAVLAADAATAQGATLAQLSPALQMAASAFIADPRNPLDLAGDATPTRFKQILPAAFAEPEADGFLVITAPQAMTDPAAVAQALIETAPSAKPVLASWMGGALAEEGAAALNRAGIPAFRYPDTAARLFAMMWSYSDTLRGLYETPSLTGEVDAATVGEILRSAVEAGIHELPPADAEAVLSAYRISAPARSLVDPQFGPVLNWEQAWALPPLNTTLARRALAALPDFARASPAEQERQAVSWVHCSQLIVEHPQIESLDVAARQIRIRRIAAAKPAIRPYPSQYVDTWTARDGTSIHFRPIRPEDEPLMVDFHQSVSDRSIYLRYFQFLKLSTRVAHERLIRICCNDYDREIAILALDQGRVLAVGRLRRTSDEDAEFGVLVIDAAQGKGLGTELVERLIRIAATEGVRTIHADVHSENGKMIHLLRKLGFQLRSEPGDPVYQAAKVIGAGPLPANR